VDLDVVFLGTSGSTPTAQRGLAATLVRRGGERILFDCGEGTQRQLLRSDVGLVELEEIFLTHFHADHYLGLPGLLKTYALRGRELPLTLYGPAGLRDLLGALRRIFGRLTYPLETVELEPGARLERDGYVLEAFAVEHGLSALGFALVESERPGRFDVETANGLGVPDGPERGALQRGEGVTLPGGAVVTPEQVLGPPRPGRKLVLAGDTAPAGSVVDAATGADVLVHEATFLADERQRARETLHSTAGEAALVAREAGVRLLALVHVSTRYFGHQVLEEARELFPETVVPRDFDVVEIPFPERGAPGLVRSGARTRRQVTEVRSSRGSLVRVYGEMTRLVQVAVAGDVTEAEELQGLLTAAGIDSQLEPAVEHDRDVPDDPPLKVLVPESDADDARDAIEALSDADEEEDG
jgi:ribonuclease Z